MKSNVIGRIVPVILTIVCAAAIFMFSMQNGADSSELSTDFLNKILGLVNRIYSEAEFSPGEIRHMRYLIRKAAHIFSCWSAWAIFQKRYILISLVFCFLYGCVDEFHQMFSDGREAAFKDVLIDTAGAFIGIVYMTLMILCVRNIRKNAENQLTNNG